MLQPRVVPHSTRKAPSESMPTIPPDTFVGQDNGEWAKKFIGFAGMEEILSLSQTSLGISGYQMARLLGSAWPGIHLNHWKNGRQCMGSLYFARLVYLFYLKFVKGYDLCYWQRIDWETGIIYTRRKNGHKDTPAQA